MTCKIKISPAIWNIGVVSLVLLIVNSALNPAMALVNTTLEDSDTDLTLKLGYFSQSLMSLVSIAGSLVAPALRTYVGYRMLIATTAIFHATVYIGMILLNNVAILVGSVVTGFGVGIIWVTIPNFVTVISKYENVERNLSYHMFIYNFNGLAGNLLNYFCLDDRAVITSSARVRYYTACTVVTAVAALLALLGIRGVPESEHIMIKKRCSDVKLTTLQSSSSVNTRLLSDTDLDISVDTSSATIEDGDGETYKQLAVRITKLSLEPGVLGLTMSNVFFGFVSTLIIVIPMCISNTYDNRHLIPLMGATIGILRIICTGLWDPVSRVVGYHFLSCATTAGAVAWLTVTMVVFPDQSSRSATAGNLALLPAGEWAVYLIGVLIGVTITGLGILVTVATGKVSRDPGVMHGFQTDVLFAYGMIVWSVSSAVTLAISPYISLHVFLAFMLVGLVANHCAYSLSLLSFIRVPGPGEVAA